MATDVQRMKQAGSNMVISCMDVQGNINMARAIQQYGLKMTQEWFSGNDQSTLNTNESLMQNVYFGISHVPFAASQSLYPGLKLYVTEMKKYEPAYVDDEIAIQGWESAALFVQGVKMAGNNLTQANVIKEDNTLTAFTADGLQSPVNWKERGSHRPRTALLPCLYQGGRGQVRAYPQQGGERLQLLRVDQPEKGPGLPPPGRHARPRLIAAGRSGARVGTDRRA